MVSKEPKANSETSKKLSVATKKRSRNAKGELQPGAVNVRKALKVPTAHKVAKTKVSTPISPEVNIRDVAKLVAQYTNSDFAKRTNNPKLLDDLARNGSTEVQMAVAGNLYTTDSTFEYLLDSTSNSKILIKIAGNRSAPKDIILSVLGSPLANETLLLTAFDRNGLTFDLQEKILSHPLLHKDTQIAAWIMSSGRLDSRLIEELARYSLSNSAYVPSDRNIGCVRQSVAGDYGFVARNLAINPKTSQTLLHELAGSPNWAARYNVLINPHTFIGDVKTLTNDRDPMVAKAAKRALRKRKRNKDVQSSTWLGSWFPLRPVGWGTENDRDSK